MARAAPTMIYLDNAATTRPCKEAVAAVTFALTERWANPSSSHGAGLAARQTVETARETIANWAGIAAPGVVFTSGGTEANHLAVLGLPLRSGTTRIVSTNAEHPSLSRALDRRRDVEIVRVPVTRQGGVDLERLQEALDERVGLIALFEGHNETGARNPIAEIVALARARAPRTLIHVDSVQSFGKPSAPPFAAGIDSAAVSAHKVHGPKGVGALLLRTRTAIEPQQVGGGQESDRRSGTENVPGIAGFGAAVVALAATPVPRFAALAALRERLARELVARIPGTRILASGGPALPHIVAAVLPGVRAEVALHHLEASGITASAGAACHAGSHALSPALKAVGLTDDEIRSTLRLSLARDSEMSDVEAVLERLPAIVARLRALGAAR
ncbi:MAG: cysteine desulfurase [Planctomycetes bacterium]|nr:cysteine desulfurase [Planctomycetota bacterium]